MSGMWELKVRDSFSAAHALRHYEGKCEKTHGHNFMVEICVEGRELDPRTEILLDFKVLKKSLKAALAELDHRLLNETPPFDKKNPSSENLAQFIWERMEMRLASCGDSQAGKTRLKYVSISETDKQSAIYYQSA